MTEVLDDLLLQSLDLLIGILSLRYDYRVGDIHFFKITWLNPCIEASPTSNNVKTLVGLEVQALAFLHHVNVCV